MEIIENDIIKEKIYKETLDNGLRVYLIPKETRKKYVIWSTKFGSVDNKFYAKNEYELTTVPDGIAHYCEHKLFEQRDGTNSLDTLTSLGVEANAYTTNDHTAYLFECTENLDKALDEFMDYVQNPFFTDENIEKERGIISQEIMMYDDYPDWKLYMNLMKALYEKNEINIDTAGTVQTIQAINKEQLYKIYNSFYVPENMIIICVGGFKVDEMLEKITSRVTMIRKDGEVKRVYNEDKDEIVQEYIEEKKGVSIPLVSIGFKDLSKRGKLDNNEIDEQIGIQYAMRDIAIDIIGDVLFGPCSEFYKKLYESGKITTDPSIQYEFSDNYGHVMIQIQTEYIQDFVQEVKNTIKGFKEKGITDEDYKRSLKCEYADIVRSFNDVSGIGNMLVSQLSKGIGPFDYIEGVQRISKTYVQEVLEDIFNEKYMAISIIK